MTQSVSGWLPNLIGPVEIQAAGIAQIPRGALNFKGFTLTDNPDNDSVDIAGDFASSGLRIANPAGTFWYTVAGSAIIANRLLTIPLLAADDTFVFANATQTLANKSFSGTTTHQGTLWRKLTVPGEVQTASATATVVASFAMLDLTVVTFEYVVTCARRTATSKGGTYRAAVTYRRNGAGPTIVGSNVAQTDQETTAGDGVAWNVNGNTIEVKVTAADTDPRNWGCELTVREVVAT